eukprot:5139309-Pleurochrysis_carterae.AAC.1
MHVCRRPCSHPACCYIRPCRDSCRNRCLYEAQIVSGVAAPTLPIVNVYTLPIVNVYTLPIVNVYKDRHLRSVGQASLTLLSCGAEVHRRIARSEPFFLVTTVVFAWPSSLCVPKLVVTFYFT